MNNPVLAAALADDLTEMDTSTAIELRTWPIAHAFVTDVKGTEPEMAKVQPYTGSELLDWSHDQQYTDLLAGLRKSDEYLCGFYLAEPAGTDLTFCQHVSCAANQPLIAAAYVVRDGWVIDETESDPSECMRCGHYVHGEGHRPERDENTYKHPAPVTETSNRIEDACMAGIRSTFTDDEINTIIVALEKVPDTPQSVWLWSMFDSASDGEPVRQINASDHFAARNWARANGIPVSDRGPVSTDVMQDYLDAVKP